MASFYPKTKAEVPFLTELEFCSKVEVTSDYFESNNATKLTTTTAQTKLPVLVNIYFWSSSLSGS